MSIPSKRYVACTSVVAAIGLALALSGCASTADRTPGGMVPPSAASTDVAEGPTVEPVPEATVDPPDAAADPVTCDTMLTPEALQELASSNLVPREFTAHSWDYPLLATIDRDGLVCVWGNQGDVRQVMGELPMEPGDWESTRAQLVTEGFVQEDDVVEGFMNGPDAAGDDYVHRGFAYRDGTLYYTSYSKFFTSFASFTA